MRPTTCLHVDGHRRPVCRRSPLLLTLFTLALVGCAPPRAPVPAGEIPAPRAVTVDEEQYGHRVLEELQQQYPLDYDDPNLARITAVVDRLTAAAKADKEPWHVYLFKAPSVQNAAATRGNHVFVWSGMMDQVANDDELAVILSHELAHVLAGHTDPDPNEEVKKILINVGAIAAGVAVSAATRNPYISADLGNVTSALTQHVGEGIALNPYSRQLEVEADTIGLMLLAEAGYNPEAAISFWSKAEANPGLSSGLQFLSTHPSNVDRLANIRAHMALAQSRARGDYRAADPNRDTFDVREQPGRGEGPAPVDRAPATAAEQWRVTRDGARLYTDADASSPALGEFRRGAVIEVSGASRGWLRVTQPDRGFLRGGEAVPLAAPRAHSSQRLNGL